MPSLRHALSAAACAALAGIGLVACDGKTDDPALRAVAGATVPAPSTSAPPITTPTSQSPAPTTAPATAPDPTTPRATKAPRIAAPAPTSRSAPASSKPRPTAADASVAGQVLALVNAERARAGCGPVALDDRLTRAAAGHSQDMVADDFFSHDSRDGRGFADRIRATGYPAPRSENIAAGQPTPSAVMDSWMRSPGHEANILDCTATRMGLASAIGGDLGIYWTQDFGTA